MIKSVTVAFGLFFMTVVNSQPQASLDPIENALVAVFQRDASSLVCAGANGGTLIEMKERIAPYIINVDLSIPTAHSQLVTAIYTHMPCPFSPSRKELRPAKRDDVVGYWSYPDSSQKLRYGPKSPSWKNNAGMPANSPPIKCESFQIDTNGSMRTTQVRGNFDCATVKYFEATASSPKVAFWKMENNRFKITRTDYIDYEEDWDLFVVQAAFDFFGVKFLPGDLVGYERPKKGNQINASTSFRHMQPLK
jgi:hypothetical protein